MRYKEICVGGPLDGKLKPKETNSEQSYFETLDRCNSHLHMCENSPGEIHYCKVLYQRHTAFFQGHRKVYFWAISNMGAEEAFQKFADWLLFPLEIP